MKKVYGIDMQGPFRVQRVASLSAWTSEDVGREVYLNSNNKRYYGNNSAWIESDIDKLWTYQDTAPTGWSIIAGTTDSLLACKGGSNAYNIAGGAQAGTWTQPGHTHGVATHIHTTGGHSLTTSEIPSHSHPYIDSIPESPYIGDGYAIATGTLTTHRHEHTKNTSNTGGGGSHSHGDTGSGGPGSTNSGATAITFRPVANVGIVVERN